MAHGFWMMRGRTSAGSSQLFGAGGGEWFDKIVVVGCFQLHGWCWFVRLCRRPFYKLNVGGRDALVRNGVVAVIRRLLRALRLRVIVCRFRPGSCGCDWYGCGHRASAGVAYVVGFGRCRHGRRRFKKLSVTPAGVPAAPL